ncbi:kinase, partial [Thraustotheca clavata]
MESEYIVKCIGVSWRRPIDIEAVLEYMDLGDLRNYLVIHSPSQFKWCEKFQCIMGIVRGLLYLHILNSPITHRNLKSSNVLLDFNKGTKLADFRTSHQNVNTTMVKAVWPYQWMAPEVTMGGGYSAADDIYSFGIYMIPTKYLLIADSRSFVLATIFNEKITEGDIRPIFQENETSLILVRNNQSNRPTSLEIVTILQRVNAKFY